MSYHVCLGASPLSHSSPHAVRTGASIPYPLTRQADQDACFVWLMPSSSFVFVMHVSVKACLQAQKLLLHTYQRHQSAHPVSTGTIGRHEPVRISQVDAIYRPCSHPDLSPPNSKATLGENCKLPPGGPTKNGVSARAATSRTGTTLKLIPGMLLPLSLIHI